ncbi:AraC family transcriptional regulator [Burkholderia sp. WAC0059]|uniref:helix-turn-helix domain-containing protein n=1 Tax=Burkholderia sp. WAC0059 TaxID=2066022 RepID=UPI000C7EA683|nr:AraC family transcriptional regulator [Burkholderia sp. WAC0059]PLZ01949.1 AraC family transcriptional regulator [Burkholderia sp. WAC0059]
MRQPTSVLLREIDALNRDAVVLSVITDADDMLNRVAHAHPHGEIFLLRSGYVKSVSDAGQWLIPAGHLCWIPPGASHGAEIEQAHGVRIHLSGALCTSLPLVPRVLAATSLVAALVDRLAAHAGPRSSLSPQESRLVAVLCDEISGARDVPIVLPMPRDTSLRRVAERWLRQPDDSAGLDELAAGANMSRRSLTRNFKAETGLSVGLWRQIARLIYGIELLAAGKSVTETAFTLGYDSVSSFAVLCQRHTGLSPGALASAVMGSRRVLP